MSLKKLTAELTALAADHGCTVEISSRRGTHLRTVFTGPNGGTQVVFSSAASGDPRAAKNRMRDMRRAVLAAKAK